MSGVPGCLRGAGNGDFSFRGSGVNSPDTAYRGLRGHAGLDVGQYGTICDAPGGRKPFRRRFTQINADGGTGIFTTDKTF